MKPIELTKEHKTKLLEMCKQLFPELIAITIEPNGYINAADGEDTYSDLIHWFEFCITHLTTKLYNISHLKDESSIKQLRGYICQEVDHPIDYLYEEFKKLK
jgi:hypothetical protein